MHRYTQHELRSVTDLNGIWDFAFLGAIDPETVNINNIAYNDRMAVPACFDATPSYAGKRGVAAYRRMIWLPDNTRYRLIFNGVNHWCRVFVNGVPLHNHTDGYTAFSVDLAGLPIGVAELVVLV